MRVAERTGLRPGDAQFRLSRLSSMVLLASFLIGILEGAAKYTQRSPVIERHMAGANAITVHIVLAIAAAAAVIGMQARRSHRPAQQGYSPWAAPLSASALARLRRTIRFAQGLSMRKLTRVMATAPLVLVLLYAPFRMGAQIAGGLDPNATVNAWGGPTYLGALLAHWLDSLVGFYVAAFLLNRLLLPATAKNR